MAESQRAKELKRQRKRREERQKAKIREALTLKGTKKSAGSSKKKKDAAPAGA